MLIAATAHSPKEMTTIRLVSLILSEGRPIPDHLRDYANFILSQANRIATDEDVLMLPDIDPEALTIALRAQDGDSVMAEVISLHNIDSLNKSLAGRILQSTGNQIARFI